MDQMFVELRNALTLLCSVYVSKFLRNQRAHCFVLNLRLNIRAQTWTSHVRPLLSRRVTDVEFARANWLGSREICFKWRELRDYVRVEIVGGAAERIALADWDTSQVCSTRAGRLGHVAGL